MFDSLRQAFREAVDNFQTELNRDAVPEAADRLLKAMEREVVEVRLHLEKLEKERDLAKEEAVREGKEARTCLRREEMARSIGDAETEKVARDFAARHLRRKDLLEEKARVLDREIEDRHAELEGMTAQLGQARTSRDSLAASAGRTGARERIRDADGLFSELDRLADRIRDFEARAGAAEELGELELADVDGEPAPTRLTEEDLDARLTELKRRMEGG